MIKKIIASTLVMSIGLSAAPLPKYKSSIGFIVGNSSYTINDNDKNVIVGGLSFRSEKRVGLSSLYYGLGVDFPISGNIKMENKDKVSNESIGVYGTIGYHITKKLSINGMAGWAYDSYDFKNDEKESKIGSLYGASIDYRIEGVTTGVMLRNTKHTIDNYDIESKQVLFRMGILF